MTDGKEGFPGPASFVVGIALVVSVEVDVDVSFVVGAGAGAGASLMDKLAAAGAAVDPLEGTDAVAKALAIGSTAVLVKEVFNLYCAGSDVKDEEGLCATVPVL